VPQVGHNLLPVLLLGLPLGKAILPEFFLAQRCFPLLALAGLLGQGFG
jgi:hypothetical protein